MNCGWVVEIFKEMLNIVYVSIMLVIDRLVIIFYNYNIVGVVVV